MVFLWLLLLTMIIPDIVAMNAEQTHSRTPSSSSDSRIYKKHVAQLTRTDSSNSSSGNGSAINRKVDELINKQKQDPGYAKKMKVGLDIEEMQQNAQGISEELQALELEHQSDLKAYQRLMNLSAKIATGGFAMLAGYALEVYPQKYQKECFGAGMGISAIGTLGWCYGKWQTCKLIAHEPTAEQAVAKYAEKNKQK